MIIAHHLILAILKSYFLILGKGDTFDINGRFVAPEKNLILILVKQRQFFFLISYYNADNSCLIVNGNEIYKFKASNKNDNFPSPFCPGRISQKFINLTF